jgi:hypothetical protein
MVYLSLSYGRGVTIDVGTRVGVFSVGLVAVGVTPAGITCTVTCAVRVVVPQIAVSVYVVVVAGFTVMLPGVATPPMSLSISAASAFATNPQLSVVVAPAGMITGAAVNDSMVGAPAQVDGGIVVGAKVGAGAGVPTENGVAMGITVILAQTVAPKDAPLALRRRQLLVYIPGVAGAVIGTVMSTVAPGAVFGTAISAEPPSAVPPTGAST